MSSHPFADVVLAIPVDRSFTYRVPEALSPTLVPGMRVRVPFRTGKAIGYCVGRSAESSFEKVKEIAEVLDATPVADRGMLELTRWVADYYRCSWGEALEAAVPAAVRRAASPRPHYAIELAMTAAAARAFAEALPARGANLRRAVEVRLEVEGALTQAELARHAGVDAGRVRELVARGVFRRVAIEEGPDPYLSLPVKMQAPPALHPDQARALAQIERAIASEAFSVLLLFGVTGSGKTEVYLRAIATAVARGRQAIVMVPEIALTPQTTARFRARFERVAVLHSGMAAVHRTREWERLRAGEADVVIGPRSAVFAPVPRLGLIVVDEEHEPSYKQDHAPRYHARDVAVMRGKQERVPVVLGSATPSLESYQHALTGKYELLRLPERVVGGGLPRVEIVDMSAEVTAATTLPLVSRQLDLLIRQGLARREQAILFLNRRGFATLIVCPKCKSVVRCERCSVALTYHRRRAKAECHYCREDRVAPDRCAECGHAGIRFLGAGTEKVEGIVGKLYAGSRIARMDGDTMRGRNAHAKLLTDLHGGEVDLLVGTQMVAKGHDVPNVTLVGVISGDTCLQLKDFRSAERTFQLIAQVAGRAGRGAAPGRVVVQTMNPAHYAIRSAAAHDFEGFARRELQLRRELGYPPFGRLLRILVDGKESGPVEKAAGAIARALSAELPQRGLTVLGAAAAPIERIKDRFRWHVLVKGDTAARLRAVALLVEARFPSAQGVEVTLDVDPLSLL